MRLIIKLKLGDDTLIKFLDSIFNKIEYYFDNAIEFLEKFTDAFFLVLKYIIIGFDKFSSGLMESIYNIFSKRAKLLRVISLPWSAIIPKGYKLYLKYKVKQIPLLRPGVQMVRAKVGGGKSLTSFVLAKLVLERTGYPSYMTSSVEKPKLSEDGKYWYVLFPVIDLNTYYANGKKLKRFNTKKYKNMHKDENHLRFNPRLNKTKEYNDKFIPEHKDELLMRHDGFDTITKYSQHIRLDSQDMETIDLMHEVETIKDIPIKRWVDDGMFKYIPIKLKFESYKIEVQFDGTIKRKLYKKWSLPVPYDVLLEFNTYAEANASDGLPYDF